jgi:hypothetical protein
MTGVAKKFGREVNRRRTKVSKPQGEVSSLAATAGSEAEKPDVAEGVIGEGRSRCRTGLTKFPANREKYREISIIVPSSPRIELRKSREIRLIR